MHPLEQLRDDALREIEATRDEKVARRQSE